MPGPAPRSPRSPDLSEMYVDLKLEEVDRGKLRLGQDVRIRVDAIPDKEFTATLNWISPIAALIFKGGSTAEKTFPARATISSWTTGCVPA